MAFYVVDNATLKAENPPPPGTSPWLIIHGLHEAIFSPLRRKTPLVTKGVFPFPGDFIHQTVHSVKY